VGNLGGLDRRAPWPLAPLRLESVSLRNLAWVFEMEGRIPPRTGAPLPLAPRPWIAAVLA